MQSKTEIVYCVTDNAHCVPENFALDLVKPFLLIHDETSGYDIQIVWRNIKMQSRMIKMFYLYKEFAQDYIYVHNEI